MTPQRFRFDANARMVLWAWLSSRLLLWAFVMVGNFRLENTPLSEKKGLWMGVSSFWLGPWTTFDSRHYIGIAQSGYTPFRAAFFPLYPFILRLSGGAGGSDNRLALVGVVVSNLCFLVALWLLFCLTRDEWGENVARRAVWIEAFFPAAAFSAAVYTESLFLMLSIGLFWFARRKNWWASGVCGFLAGLARNSGPILCVALLLDRPKEPLSTDEKRKRALCAVTPLLAFVAVQLFIRAQLGGGNTSLSSQQEFGRVLTFPLVPLMEDVWSLMHTLKSWRDFVTFPEVAACIGTFVLLWVYRRRFSAGKLFFIGIVLLVNLTMSWRVEPHTLSTLRYLLGTFPIAQLLALAWAEKLPSRRATMYAAAAVFALFFVHSYLFGLKDFLG